MATNSIPSAFLACFLFTSAIAQRDQGGFIKPADSLIASFPADSILYLPEDGFSFYEVPAGSFKGKILPGPPLRRVETGSDSLMTSTITGINIKPQLVGPAHYFETTDARYHLKFEQREGDYVLIFGDSYRGWIAVQEIVEKGFELVSWMAFYGESKNRMIYPRNKIAPIYQQPGTGSEIIETADELYSEITSTGKCEGTFCLVSVTQYRNPYDPEQTKEENTLKKYKGWIQIIDEEGKPLVAHNTQRDY